MIQIYVLRFISVKIEPPVGADLSLFLRIDYSDDIAYIAERILSLYYAKLFFRMSFTYQKSFLFALKYIYFRDLQRIT